MGHKYAELAFTPTVREVQQDLGSRKAYAGHDEGEEHHSRLGEQEAAFIAARDSFYMATVGETGWPYIQHRGGPPGFVRIIDEKTIAFPDFRGNRQYITIGNLKTDDRVSLFFMDYPHQARLKMLGRAQITDAERSSDIVAEFSQLQYKAKIEHVILIKVDAFDWNCSQHIMPRFTPAEITAAIAPLKTRIAELEGQLAALGNSGVKTASD